MIKSNKHQHINIKQGQDYRNELQIEMEILLRNQLEKLNCLDKLEILNYDQVLAKLIKNSLLKQVQETDPKIQQIFLNSLWQTNFTIQCLNQMLKAYDLQSIIRQLLTLSEGYFNVEKTSYVEIQQLRKFQGYFIHTHENYSLAFEIGVQAFEFQNKFEINHVMTFIDFRFDSNQLEQSIQKYHNSLNLNPMKRLSFQNIEINPQIIVQKKDRTQYQEVFLFAATDKWSDLLFNKIQNQSNMKWIPNEFCSQNQIDQIKYQQTKESIIKQNQIILNQYASFPEALLILNILTNIPDFKYKTTQQQRQVIGTKQSSISIGRSGTGKTLSQILRIFLAELNFKGKLKQYGTEEPQLLFNTYSQQNTGLHQIYTTLNPVLIGEVRRYYDLLGKMVESIILKGNTNNNDIMQSQSILNIQSILQEGKLLDENIQNKTLKGQDRGEIDNISKLSDLLDSHFPGFLTVQKLLLMIDGSLSKPFFKNDYFQKQYKRTGRAGWDDGSAVHISLEMKNMITLSNNTQSFSHQSKLNIPNTTSSNLNIQVIQVDYRYFMTRFWPSIKKIHAQTEDNNGFMNIVWTQIYSIIKGSQYSHIYPDNALPKCIYLRQNKDIYDQSTLNTIYDYYLLYEQWKKEKQLFDQMDLVNYIMNQIDAGEYNGTPIHYLTVDEIQDLPHALIELLSKITEQSLQLCGDTAQNIVQGVGFRFQDLKTIFKNQVEAGETKFSKFDFYQLTVNFRAHNNLLQLANNVVSLLEIFFPKSIDRLQKEVSNSPGPKPFLVESRDENVLISLLAKQFNNKTHQQIEFGCNQVILVKNDEAKASIPKCLQNALILTVYESKGLEFDDVILYNYFSDDSLSKDKWNIINNLFIEETMQDLQSYTDHQQSEQSKDCSIITVKYNNSILVRKLRIKPSFRAYDLSNFNDLCAELKMLYVAITRPKKRLIIFDNDTSRREAIQSLWNQLGLINMDDQQFIEFTPQRDEQGEVPKQEWFKVGQRMFDNKYYEQAAKCFKMAGADTEFINSQAFANATKAQQMQYEYEQTYADCPKYNIKQKDQFKQNYLSKFEEAAQCFEKIQIHRKSGDCYFSGQIYDKALIQYIKCQSWVEAAECAQKIKKYLISSILFFKAEIYDLGLKMIENTNQTIYIMSALLICKQNISDTSMEQALCKYFPKYVKMLQISLDKKGEIQTQSKLNEDTEVIIESCFDYEQQFKQIMFYFDQFQITIINLEDFIRELIQSIKYFSKHFLDLIQKQNINYDIIKYQIAVQQKNTSIALQEFVFDILDYFKLRQEQKFVSDDNNNQHEKLIISQLFDKSILYEEETQNIEQLNNKISEVEKYALDLITSIPKICQHVFFNFSLLTLGFYQQMKYQLIGRICSKNKNYMIFFQQKSALGSIFGLQSELLEVCLLFRNFTLPLNFTFLSRSPEQHQLFGLYQEIIQQKNLKFNLDEFRQKLTELHHLNFDRSSSELPNFLDNLKKLNSLQYQYLLASSYIINLIQQCDDRNSKLFQSLLDMDQPLVEQFMAFVMMCAKILKYNVCIRQQKLAFQVISLIFGFQIPTYNAFRYFGQSYAFITTKSPFFKDFCAVKRFCVSFDRSVYIIESSFVIKNVQNYFYKFLSDYSREYIQLKKKLESSNQSFLFLYYAKIVKQNNIHQNEQIEINQTNYNFLLEKWLQFLIKINQYQLGRHKNELYNPELVDIYLDYALSLFKKATISSDIHQQHKKLYIGFQISNIVQTQRYSIEILDYLMNSNRNQDQYYQLSYNYINFLQTTIQYYSIYQTKNVIKYFQYLFKNGFYDIEIYLKDLYLICLNIIVTYKAVQKENHQQIDVILPSTMLILPQIRQKDFFTIKVENFDKQKFNFEMIINSFQDMLIDYSEQKKHDFKQIYIIFCTLALNTKINTASLEYKIKENINKSTHKKHKIFMEQLLCLLKLKQTSNTYEKFSDGFKFIHKKLNLQFENYFDIYSNVQYNLSKLSIQDDKLEKIIQQKSIKFSYPYIGNRLILSLALNKMEQHVYRPDKLQEPQIIRIYTLIVQNRMKSIELLYSIYIVGSIHYHNVTNHIRQLSVLEEEADSLVNGTSSVHVNEKLILRLELLSKKINEWIQEKENERELQKESRKIKQTEKLKQGEEI